MPGYGETERTLIAVLSDGRPRSFREFVKESNLTVKQVEGALYRLRTNARILRTEKPVYEENRAFKGRSGIRRNTRAYHLYMSALGRESLVSQGMRFVKWSEDSKKPSESKAELIRRFLQDNGNQAFYTTNVAEALKARGIKQTDIMNTVKRAEDRHLVYVRGYQMHDRQTPFKEGYLITWIDAEKPREQAIEEAVQRTDKALAQNASTSPIIERVHMIRDLVIETTKLRDLASFEYIQNKLGCTEYEAEGALKRTMQLYPELREVKLFDAYRYYYHTSLANDDLNAAIAMKENYLRLAKGRMNRVGHNWEACVEWFVDKFTTGAAFRTQNHHENRMDPRRITLHLMKSVGGRKYNAEVDRIWEVTPGIFSQPITYVLECKWGLIEKKYIDDFFEVLKWSKEFGVDTPDGRQVKQGVIGVFAGSAFDPKESVRLKDETKISLATYAARMNIQLLRASDFNEKMHQRAIPIPVTVQKVCRFASNEKEARGAMNAIWDDTSKADDAIKQMILKNQDIFKFEAVLKLKPDEKKVLDHIRARGSETDKEKTAKELELAPERVEKIIEALRKNNLFADYFEKHENELEQMTEEIW